MALNLGHHSDITLSEVPQAHAMRHFKAYSICVCNNVLL